MRLVVFVAVATAVLTYIPLLLIKNNTATGIVALAMSFIWVIMLAGIIWILLKQDVIDHKAIVFVSIMFTIYHVLAWIGFGIWCLDSSPNKDQFFVGVDKDASRYGIFITDFLFTALAVLNSAGFSHISPKSAAIVTGLWGMSVSLTGMLMYSFILALILQNVKLPVVTSIAKYATGPMVRPRIYKK